MIELVKTSLVDLETLFIFQADKESNWMAAFTPENPNDKAAYLNKWSKIVENPEVEMKTVWSDGDIVGSVLYFSFGEEINVSYIVDKKQWGRGLATEALRLFLEDYPDKTFYARAAFDNIGSQKVLEKNGFRQISTEKGFANARKAEIKEFVYKLER